MATRTAIFNFLKRRCPGRGRPNVPKIGGTSEDKEDVDVLWKLELI